MPIKSFRDMRIWQESHSLALAVYVETRVFPAEERYALTRQIRKSASSVSANIAEGKGRKTGKDFINFLYNARGSVQETINHLIFAKDLGLLTSSTATNLTDRYDGLSAGIQACIEGIEKNIDKCRRTSPLKNSKP